MKNNEVNLLSKRIMTNNDTLICWCGHWHTQYVPVCTSLYQHRFPVPVCTKYVPVRTASEPLRTKYPVPVMHVTIAAAAARRVPRSSTPRAHHDAGGRGHGHGRVVRRFANPWFKFDLRVARHARGPAGPAATADGPSGSICF